MQRGVKAFDRLTIFLPLFTLALIAVTLWLSLAPPGNPDPILVGTSLLMIVFRRLVIHSQGTLAPMPITPRWPRPSSKGS